MNAFERALAFTLRFEGGFSDDPRDPGGRTDRGIAETYHPAAWSDGKVTKEEAEAIYRADYWDATRCGELPELVALAVFESAVNPGVQRSIQFLQHALGLDADGRFGSVTHVKALSIAEPKALALRVCDMRAGYWLARATGEKVVYRRGWLNRSAALRGEIERG